MALFNFRKKTETKKPCCCSCGCGEQNTNIADKCTIETSYKINSIKVLGAGCKSCHQQYENAKTAVKNLNLRVEIEYITDMKKIMEYGVMSMPALIINEKIASMGKILKPDQIEKILKKSGC